jgi:hypothetical protein
VQHVSVGRPHAGFLPMLGHGRDAVDCTGGVTQAHVEPRLGRVRPLGRIHVRRGRGLEEGCADRGFATNAARVHRRRHHRLAEPVFSVGRMVVALHELGAAREHLDDLAVAFRRRGGSCQARVGGRHAI